VNRIYTIEEGKGIIGALCGGAPCAAAAPVKAAAK
jgi:hypothetical protein